MTFLWEVVETEEFCDASKIVLPFLASILAPLIYIDIVSMLNTLWIKLTIKLITF